MLSTSRNFIDIKSLIFPMSMVVLLVFSNGYSFLLFHTLVELFTIVIAVLTTVVAWQMYSFTRNHFLMYLGCGYFWVAALDLMHVFAYKGFPIFPMAGADMSTQFWIGTRYIESFLLLTAPWFLSHSLNRKLAISAYFMVSIILVVLIMTGIFPSGFIEGKGLTIFKIYSEYFIMAVIFVAIYHLFYHKKLIETRVFTLIVLAMFFTVMAELSFTFYVDVYGLSNIVGHFFKMFSYWFIFIAVIQTTLKEPFSAMSKAETYYDAIPDAAVIVDESGVIKHVNKAACLLSGQTVIDLVGKKSHDVFHGEGLDEVGCFVCQEASKKVSLSAYELETSESSWLEVSTSFVHGDSAYIEILRDITVKKTTVIALEKSEARLTITLNSIGDAVITTDEFGCVTRMNPVAEKLTGWDFNDAQGESLKNIFPIVNASTRKSIECPVDKVISKGKIIHLSNHTTLISKDGAEYQITDSAAPIRDGDDKILGMVLVFNDVTEQYKLRTSASENEALIRLLLNSTAEAIYGVDLEGKFTFVNKTCLNMLGYERDKELLGKVMHDCIHHHYFDGSEYPVEKSHIYEAYLKEVGTHIDNEVLWRKDGSSFFVEYWSHPVYSEDVCVGAVVTFLDITSRRLMEKKLDESESNLIRGQEIAKIGNWKLNPRTNEVEGSQELLNIFEISDNRIVLEDFTRLCHPDDIEDILKYISNGINHGMNWSAECRLLLSKGIIKWIHLMGEPVLGGNGEVSSIVGIVQDITIRKQLDETLRRTQKMDALGKLTGGIAHDYNNMLGVVLGYAELLEAKLGGQPDLARYVHEIYHAGKRGEKLTKKLLSFSRKTISNPLKVDINKLLKEEEHLLQKTLTSRVVINLELANDLWPVKIDEGDFEDSILNMSINAMHAMPKGGSLTFKTRNKVLNEFDAQMHKLVQGDYVVLDVIDTGVGIDKEGKEKIFEPFYSTKGDKGTGLGLSQVYGFIERSKGAIDVCSELNQGAHFSLYFPRYDVSDVVSQEAVVIETEVLGGKETVLVVDDELGLLNLTSEILRQEGYYVVTAENGKQALDILESESVDLLLSDVIMPLMDGYQLASIVQKKYPDIKIQLVSGFSDDRHIQEGDVILHKNIISKPFQSKTLLKKVRDLLG